MRQAVMRQIHAGNVEVRSAVAGRPVLPSVWLTPAMHLRECPARASLATAAGCCHGRERQAPELVIATSPPCCLQVSIVGDLDPAELEECVLKYLGTVNPEPKARVGVGTDQALLAPAYIAPGLCGKDLLRLGSLSSPAQLAQRRGFLAHVTRCPPLCAQVPLPEDPAVRLGRPLAIQQGVPLPQRHMTWHLKDSGALRMLCGRAGGCVHGAHCTCKQQAWPWLSGRRGVEPVLLGWLG